MQSVAASTRDARHEVRQHRHSRVSPLLRSRAPGALGRREGLAPRTRYAAGAVRRAYFDGA